MKITKLAIINGHKFRVSFRAEETSRLNKWRIEGIEVKDIQTNKIIYRGDPFNGIPQSLKGAVEKVVKTATKPKNNKEINKEIEAFEKWDGVIKS
ncbi:hypothetical protein [Bacillus altitudinis]|uniref:hypothetical protein n=1 Tax=Bacillus altitudinis TaxID=293387 RepID=UPI0011A7EA5E|nr:hypothetical protein [Bacillus altitudinis]